jgi:hypothetical protein
MDRDKMSNLYREPSIDAAYQISVHLGKIRSQTWSSQSILVSDWLISKKIFSSETAFPNELKFGRKHE